MINLTINGRVVEAEKGEFLLKIIRRMGLDVPALCHHESVEPFGACRLCLVEITKTEWDGWTNYVTACLYPADQDLIVQTHSPKVIELRRQILDMLMARCPGSPEIRQLAVEHGVNQTSYETVPDGDNCILCGLCTRICDRLGFHAISTVGRGHGKEIAPPLREAPADCVGCLSCALNCPTNFIEWKDAGDKRVIWGREFERIKCVKCGKLTISRTFAEALSEMRNIPIEYFETCDDCHRAELSLTMGKIAGWSREEATS